MKVFLSYAWTNKGNLDQIDSILSDSDADITRDTRDLKHLDNIFDFMNTVAEHDFAILLISQDYLKSKNCMYEALKLLEHPEFDSKYIPVFLDNLDIFDAIGRLGYVKYWEDSFDELNSKIKELQSPANTHEILKELEHYRKIRDRIDDFLNKLISIRGFTFNEVVVENDKNPLLNILGLKFKKEKQRKSNEFLKFFINKDKSNDNLSKSLSSIYLEMLELWRIQSLSKFDLEPLISICDKISSYFLGKNNHECRVSLRILLEDNNDVKVKTLVRASTQSPIDEFISNISDNTAYSVIMSPDYTNDCFISNDLKELYNSHMYKNPNSNWKMLYQSLLVVPIWEELENKKYHAIGFITIDSVKTEYFQQDDIEFIKGIARYLYHPILTIEEQLNK